MTVVRVYAARWSQDSKQLASTIETFGKQFAPDADFQFSWLEEDEDNLHQDNAVRVYPTLARMGEDGREVARKTGKIDLVELVEFTKE